MFAQWVVLLLAVITTTVSATAGTVQCDADNFNATCTSGGVVHEYDLDSMWYYAHVGWQCAVSALVISSVTFFSWVVWLWAEYKSHAHTTHELAHSAWGPTYKDRVKELRRNARV